MSDTNKIRPRGRPRRFDPEEGLKTAQQLFHARGYDALGVAEITAALGINPPSFYAAFGSKAGLYAKVLERYTGTRAIPLDMLLLPDQPVGECLAAVLEEAARRYAAEAGAAGCLVLENVRCEDDEARKAARVLHEAAQERIHAYIAERYPQEADSVTDFVCATMAGLSARARDGLPLERLLTTARLAGRPLVEELTA